MATVKTFHGANQARHYIYLCDGGLYLQHNCIKNTEWFKYSNTIKVKGIILYFNSMTASSSKLNCSTHSYYLKFLYHSSKEDLAF